MKKRTPIAVVGMAGVFPKAADLNIFWHNIINKIDSTSDVLKDRWIVEPDLMYNPDPMPDKAFSKRCCLIDADILQSIKSNHTGINIDKDFLKDLDPLYHLVLHAGKEALSDCVTSSLNKERIGTILAAIALPTDASSLITRKILGRSFGSSWGQTLIISFCFLGYEKDWGAAFQINKSNSNLTQVR